ncbi:unnamed protein product [Kuraishia capsulata CBS 1993]|uniref:Uncharacterized protein n=1 Tax=Kuraishia capsulata CBS 1993 TaxID=1382522 RepID=W6MVX5_9ASCO|nr:uncharacterized protein KUCA_T00002608001 [Kuraishia capsulata CBS 1993]CDK26635.1 unnamed protein product [Kuraishia capsulata CBS 1993]
MLRQFIRREVWSVRPTRPRPRPWPCTEALLTRQFRSKGHIPRPSLAKELIDSALNSIEQLVYRELDPERYDSERIAMSEISTEKRQIQELSLERWTQTEKLNIQLPEHRLELLRTDLLYPFSEDSDNPLLHLERLLGQNLDTRLSPLHYLKLYLQIDAKSTISYPTLCALVRILVSHSWYANASAVIEESRLNVMALFDLMEEHVVPVLKTNHAGLGTWDFLRAYLRTSSNLPLIKQMIQEFLLTASADPQSIADTVRALQFTNLLESKYLGEPWKDKGSKIEEKNLSWEMLQTDMLGHVKRYLGSQNMPPPVLAYMFLVRFKHFSAPPAKTVARALATEFKRGHDFLHLPGLMGKAISIFGEESASALRNDNFANVLCERVEKNNVTIGLDDMIAFLKLDMSSSIKAGYIKRFWNLYCVGCENNPQREVLHATLSHLQTLPHSKETFSAIFSEFWQKCDPKMVAEWMEFEFSKFQQKNPSHSKLCRLSTIWRSVQNPEMLSQSLAEFQRLLLASPKGLSFPHVCTLLDSLTQHEDVSTLSEPFSQALVEDSFSKAHTNQQNISKHQYLSGFETLLKNKNIGMVTRGMVSMKALRWALTISKSLPGDSRWIRSRVGQITAEYFIDATVSEKSLKPEFSRTFIEKINFALDQENHDLEFGQPRKLVTIDHLTSIAHGLSWYTPEAYNSLLKAWLKEWCKRYGADIKNEHYTMATAIKYLTRLRLRMPSSSDKALSVSALIDKTYGYVSNIAIEEAWLVPGTVTAVQLHKINYQLTITARAFLIKRLSRVEPLTANQFIKAYSLKTDVPKPLLRAFITGILESDSEVGVSVKARIFNHISSRIRARATGYTGKQTAIALVNAVITDAIKRDKGSSDRLMWALEICRSEKVNEEQFAKWFTILEELRRQRKGFWSQTQPSRHEQRTEPIYEHT